MSPFSDISEPASRRHDDTDAVSFRFKRGVKQTNLFDNLVSDGVTKEQDSKKRKSTESRTEDKKRTNRKMPKTANVDGNLDDIQEEEG